MSEPQPSASPLSSRARVCVEQFKRLTGIFRDTSCQSKYGISEHEILDSLERFKIWAGSLGAFQSFESKSSLDYRLRDAPKVATQVSHLLDDLEESLNDAYCIASNARPNRKCLIEKSISENGSAEEDGYGRPSDDVCSNEDEDKEELSEIDELFKTAADTITSLFRISIIVRNSTNRDRYAKATAAALKIPFDDSYDIGHVGHKFPRLEIKDSEWLKVRLGKAITQRRQYLRYFREHHEKLSQEQKSPLKHNSSQITKENDPTRPILVEESGLPVQTQSVISRPTTTLAPTQASTLILSNLENLPEDESHDAQSSTSYATSTVEDNSSSCLQVIELERASGGLDHFQCPYCFQLQNFKNQRSWRKHVMQDLKPYVCTFQDCDLKLYSDHEAWFSHELQDHRREWHCYFCTHEPFQSAVRYRQHLEIRHFQKYTQEQQSALLEMSERAVDKVLSSDCPFCEDWDDRLRAANPQIPSTEGLVVTPSQFQRHVAAHMEQLALFAIPRGLEESEDADTNEAAPDIALDHLSVGEAQLDQESEILQLFQAMLPGGSEDDVRRLLENGGDANRKLKSDDKSLLQHAICSHRSASMIKLLLAYGADPNLRDKSGASTLMEAAKYGQHSTMKILLERDDAEPDATDGSNRTVLSWAAGSSEVSNVALLLARHDVQPDSKDKSGSTPLSWAARQGAAGNVHLLLENSEVQPDSKNNKDETPLLLASVRGSELILKMLLKTKNVQLWNKDKAGRTPLSAAASNGHILVVRALVEEGGSFAREFGDVALSVAASNGHSSVVEYLLQAHLGDPDFPDNSGRTPISRAAQHGHESVVCSLLRHGAHIREDTSGRTPLSRAAQRGYEPIVRLLLRGGSTIDVDKDSSGISPLDWAKGNGHESIAELLEACEKSAKARVDLIDSHFRDIILPRCQAYFEYQQDDPRKSKVEHDQLVDALLLEVTFIHRLLKMDEYAPITQELTTLEEEISACVKSLRGSHSDAIVSKLPTRPNDLDMGSYQEL